MRQFLPASVNATMFLLEFIDAGVRHVVLAPILRDIDRPVHWLADELVRPIVEQIGQPV